MFSAVGAGGKGPKRPGAGAWPAAGAGAGAGRARTEPSLVCRPREQPSTPGASLPEPSFRAFGSSPCFFRCEKTPNPSDSAVYNLPAAGGLLGNCDGGSSRLVNAFQSSWQGSRGDFLWDAARWECQLFLAGGSRTSGVSNPWPGHGDLWLPGQERRGHLGHLHPGMRGTTCSWCDHAILKSLKIGAVGAWELVLMG